MKSYAIVVDNCKKPTPSLLRRVRSREMMELSASRWDPTPAATTLTSATVATSPSLGSTPEEQSPAHTQQQQLNLGPKVPRRQVSPPLQKRDNDTSPKQGRPNKPVRSKSPLVQPRADEDSSSSTCGSTLQMSPMVPSRTSKRSTMMNSKDNIQQKPRMPQRKSSLLHKSHTDQAAIQRLLHDASGADSNKAMDDSSRRDSIDLVPSLLVEEDNPSGVAAAPRRRPSFLSRQSSFEILPATLPTRQSSFELRHRAAASPLSEKVVSEILAPTPKGGSPRRSKSDSVGGFGPTKGPRKSMNLSLPNLYLQQARTDCNTMPAPPMDLGGAKASREEAKEESKLKVDSIIDQKELGLAPSKKVPPSHDLLSCPTTPKPPSRKGSFLQQAESGSPDSGGSSKNRFHRYRHGASKPSLPVRNSSFDLGHVDRNKAKMLPGRQSSFPGLVSSFQKL